MYLTKSTSITIVLIFAVVVRVLFAMYQPKPLITADSIGYYQLGVQMVENPRLETIISEFRTPLYPIFLASLSKLLGFNDGSTIADIQQLVGVAGVIIFFSFLIRMGFSRKTTLIFSLLTAGNILVFYWERALVTEGLATTTFIMSLLIFAHTLQTPRTKNFILLWISYGINFLLRPAFVFLPVVTLPFLFIVFKRRSEKLKVFITLLMSCLVPALYIVGNTVYHEYKGIQHVGDIDVLGRILEFDTPIEAGKAYSYFYESVTDYRNRKGNPMPFEFINTYDDSMYVNTTRMNELQGFTRSVVLGNLPSYVTDAFATIPSAMTDVSPFIKISDDSIVFLHIFFSGLLIFYRTLLPFTLVALFLYPIAMYLFIKEKSTKRILLATLGSVILCQIFLTVLVVYKEDYGRLFASIQPLLFVFIIGTLQELFIHKRRA